MPPLYPDVNGNRTSYCSIDFGIDGILIKGIKSISYGESLEIKKIRGTSAKPIGRNRGNVDFEGEIEFYQAEWHWLLPILTRAGLFGFSELGHSITVTHAELLSPADTVTDRIISARLHSPKMDQSEGGEITSLKCTLDVMDIYWSQVYQGLRQRPF